MSNNSKASEEKEAEKKAQEAKIKASEEKEAFKNKLEKEKSKKGYVPEIGTGRHFHVKIEQNNADSETGEKLSSPFIQVMDSKMFVKWVNTAAGLHYSFGLVHDATELYNTKGRSESQLKISIEKALKNYAMNVKYSRLAFAAKNLCSQKGFVNGKLKDYFKQVSDKRMDDLQKSKESHEFLK